MATAILSDSISKEHRPGEGHPERPERFSAVLRAIDSASMLRLPSRAATDDELALCHTRPYIDLVRREILGGMQDLSTGDTAVSARSLEAALHATGGVLNAVDAVFSGKARNAFCCVRPPGHHATPNRGMGFCIFNSVAVAARYAQRKHGAERILIADWDVHHGNGTQDVFYNDASVFLFSTHQSPWYPGTGDAGETGEGAGRGATLNCPFPAGSGAKEIIGAFREQLLPAARKHRPDLVLISAGFDSRAGDPLGRFTLTDTNFAELTRMMMDVADSHAHGRLVSVLEGGYNLAGLASAAAAHVSELSRES